MLGEQLPAGGLYRLLADEGHRLFGDDYFADLFAATRRGRPSVPARTVATVMLLQAHEGLSDREACDRLAFDLRWKAAAGLAVDACSFHPTVLVGLRNRLRASVRPRRLFEDVNGVACRAGLGRSRVRVLDSTPLLDAVATQDTVTQLRAGVRKLLMAADKTGADGLAARVRAGLARDDDYAGPGKPVCDWDDAEARERLVDALVRDAYAALAALDGQELPGPVAEAAELLGLVAGQDVEIGDDGVFRIAVRVARDRTISTVDPEARHGHKSRARRFDGYKTHIALDPDTELITEITVTPGNTADRDTVDDLLSEPAEPLEPPQQSGRDTDPESDGGLPESPHRGVDESVDEAGGGETSAADQGGAGWTVVGDSAYADGATLDRLTSDGHTVMAKVPPARNTRGGFTKDDFHIDVDRQIVTCPAGRSVAIRPRRRGGGQASFGQYCAACPLRQRCTRARRGRALTIHPHEAALQRAKAAQADPEWQATYRATRPKAERKIAHFTRRPWGGRQARSRGTVRIATDLDTRAGALNLARLAVLRLHHGPAGWAITP